MNRPYFRTTRRHAKTGQEMETSLSATPDWRTKPWLDSRLRGNDVRHLNPGNSIWIGGTICHGGFLFLIARSALFQRLDLMLFKKQLDRQVPISYLRW